MHNTTQIMVRIYHAVNERAGQSSLPVMNVSTNEHEKPENKRTLGPTPNTCLSTGR